MADNFICAQCNGTFEKGWSDEEAMEEMERNFPGLGPSFPVEGTEVICDDCYQDMMKRRYSYASQI